MPSNLLMVLMDGNDVRAESGLLLILRLNLRAEWWTGRVADPGRFWDREHAFRRRRRGRECRLPKRSYPAISNIRRVHQKMKLCIPCYAGCPEDSTNHKCQARRFRTRRCQCSANLHPKKPISG